MTEPLWPDDKIHSALDPVTERCVSYDAAFGVLSELQRAYEVDRQSQAATIALLNTNATSLSDEVIGLETQARALKAQVADLSPDVTVAIGDTPIMTSRFETAVSHVDGKDLLWAKATAKASGMATLAPAFVYHQLHLMGYASGDPWPWNGTGTRPAEPTNWGSLDALLNMSLAMGGTLALNTQLYPWHLKGKWNADGTTTPMTYAEQFSDSGVLMTNQVSAYLLLIQRMAERYLVAPYNVRLWITGTEFHGLYLGRQRNFNEWRWDDYPGTPGPNADMGMAYLHNITADKIVEVAIAKGIDPASLTIINNYPPFVSLGKPTGDSVPVGHALRGRVWGTANKHAPSILTHMPPLLRRLDAIGFDIRLSNKDGMSLTDDFTALAKFDECIAFTQATVPGKPVAILELYDNPQSGQGTPAYRAALRAEAFRRMVLGGVWLAFLWGTAGEPSGPDAALLTTEGQATPLLDVVRLFHDHFGPGTPIYEATITGEGVSALPSDKVTVLINQTNTPRKVAMGGDVYALAPYAVRDVLR